MHPINDRLATSRVRFRLFVDDCDPPLPPFPLSNLD